MTRLPIDRSTSVDDVVEVVTDWVEANVPEAWRRAAAEGGRSAIRTVRSRADYEAWYPTLADSGLAVATWPGAYGGEGEPASAFFVAVVPFLVSRLMTFAPSVVSCHNPTHEIAGMVSETRMLVVPD